MSKLIGIYTLIGLEGWSFSGMNTKLSQSNVGSNLMWQMTPTSSEGACNCHFKMFGHDQSINRRPQTSKQAKCMYHHNF